MMGGKLYLLTNGSLDFLLPKEKKYCAAVSLPTLSYDLIFLVTDNAYRKQDDMILLLLS